MTCEADEFNDDGKCEKCDNTISILIVVGSVLSFIVVTYYVDKISKSSSRM
eukprot:CAMPEP_0182495784 /NCGR_PEP_ID=MMETSP1321-20130603/4523_1 /TAXON_ID=91990 /ORGANISM="Bolidomonas sp., Strain RCC1657" /LENGTH=50 /DNA_ID=CAMNT_0024699237 /DNA_START=110 /DNA_END=259 /DNA_ORIENTATION=+